MGSDRGCEEAVGRDLALASLAVARRFASGATMWCVAPQWPFHARHVAVEFVHPVVVGKRSLPAAHVDDLDPLGALRVVSSPSDILLAVAGAGERSVATTMRHARAWGLLTLWIGCGRERPEPGAADHVLWLGQEEIGAAYGGGLVLAYHLLWELVHVCFEHPGLLLAEPAQCLEEVCVTCSDEGRVAEVVDVLPGNRANVRTAGGIESVDTTLIDPPSPGGLILVHAGAAIARVEETPG